jgi:flagellar motor switch/type III secretory pathway protein FliN
LPASLFEFGAGAVYFSCEQLGLYAIADHSIWRAVPPNDRARTARPKLTPVDQAVKRPTARIDVVLGAVELDLSNMLDLRNGDVLRLPQRLDEGLSVLCEGQLLARGALGERDGRVSVQLISRSATP